MAVTRRSALRGVGALGLVTAAPTVLSGRRIFAQDVIPVGSILDATGPINIYGLPMIDSTRSRSTTSTRTAASWAGRSG